LIYFLCQIRKKLSFVFVNSVINIVFLSGYKHVIAQCKKPTAQMAHLVFADTRAKAQKTERAIFCQRTDRLKELKK
jgi:hypothetical protein